MRHKQKLDRLFAVTLAAAIFALSVVAVVLLNNAQAAEGGRRLIGPATGRQPHPASSVP